LDAAMEEIRLLKNIVAKQSIELEFKTELLNLPADRQEKVNPLSSVDRSNATVSNTSYGKWRDLLQWSGVPSSSFYYKRGDGIRGRKPSTMTIKQDGELIENAVVLQDVESILQQEFCCYGYKNIWDELKDKGYVINHKKVYRLMKIHNLLFNRRIGSIGVPRQFVRFRKIRAEKPLEHLCMDIKYIHIHGAQRNALLLTVIDAFSRKVLTHMLRFNIKKGDVIILLSLLLMEYKIEGITIRNDNGSQLIAHVVRQFLKDKGVNQEFTHVATPEENAYIEALHSNI
jgi:putative transposase